MFCFTLYRAKCVAVVAAFAFASMVGGTSWAQNAAVGDWKVVMDVQGQIRESTVRLSEDGGALKGVWISERGETDLSDVKFEDGKLTFVREVEFGGQSMTLNYSGMIDGDTLTGSFNTDFGEFPANGERVDAEPAADGGSSDGLAGVWTMMVESDLGSEESELTFHEKDGKISATWVASLGTAEIEEVKVDGDNISFTQATDLGTLEFSGTAKAGKIEGTLKMDLGGEMMEMPVTGSKAGAVAMPAVAGTWDLTATGVDDGSESEVTLTIREEDGKLVGTMVTAIGTAEIEEIHVVGDEIHFKTVLGEDQGLEIATEVKGKIVDGVLDVVATLDMDGTPTSYELKGSKAVPAIAGTWEMVAIGDDGAENLVTLVIKDEGGKLTAELDTPLGSAKSDEVKLNGDQIEFTANLGADAGIDMPLTVIGTFSGDTFKGSATLNMEGQEMKFDLEGTKQSATEAEPVAEAAATDPS